MTLLYDSDDALNLSPGLTPVKPRATPTPSPEPEYPKPRYAAEISPRTGKPRKQKVQPSQGDVVLLSFLDPNRPDIARRAGEVTILDSDDDETFDPGHAMGAGDPRHPRPLHPDEYEQSSSGLEMTAERALAMAPLPETRPALSPERVPSFSRPQHLNIRTGFDVPSYRPEDPNPPLRSPFNLPFSPKYMPATEMSSGSARSPQNPPLHSMSIRSAGSAFPPVEPLRNLQIPDRESRSAQRLPALHSPSSPVESPGSPQQVVLPGMDQMLKVADVGNVANHENGLPTPHTGYPPTQRHSISSPSAAALSPSATTRPYPTGGTAHRHSSASQYPYSHSPISAQSEAGTSPYDAYAKSSHGLSPPGGIPLDGHFFNTRRPSQVSENGRSYSHSLPSASSVSADTCGSSETYSPTSKAEVRDRDQNRMSIDGATLTGTPSSSMAMAGTPGSATTGTPGSGAGTTIPSLAQALPSIHGIQTVPAHGTGSFQCDYPGCQAPPFQTQYLLNSHANVHSQNRPHFCPVPGCPRGEGGKGFKRKNEMIRHGLVHDSPGYVCPFCPDQEHKYPRPDNLQRHVRVHHSERNKDDPLLREVLQQRPEGGQRGRRRRVVG